MGASIRRSSLMAGLNPMAFEFDPSVMDQHAKAKGTTDRSAGGLTRSKQGSRHFYMVQENTSEARQARAAEKRASLMNKEDRAKDIRRKSLITDQLASTQG